MNPLCLRYLGPFRSEQDAEAAKGDQVRALEKEQMNVLFARARFCQPRQSVIYEQSLTMDDYAHCPSVLFEAVISH